MNTLKNKSFAAAFINNNLPVIIKNIKVGIRYMYVENMFVNNEEISMEELSRLNKDEFRYQVKTAVMDLVIDHNRCDEITRYITRMSTQRMMKKFNYNEVNKFYINEVIHYLYGV